MRTSQYPRVHDVLLYYSRRQSCVWNPQYADYGEAQLRRYKQDESGRMYAGQDLTMMSSSATPPANRAWAAPLEQLEAWFAEGRILTKKDGQTPRLDGLKVFLDERPGKMADSVWTDIPRIGNTKS